MTVDERLWLEECFQGLASELSRIAVAMEDLNKTMHAFYTLANNELTRVPLPRRER